MSLAIHHFQQETLQVEEMLVKVLGPGKYESRQDYGALNSHGTYTLPNEKLFLKIATSERSSTSLVERFMAEPRNAYWAAEQGLKVITPRPGMFHITLASGGTAAISVWDFASCESPSAEETFEPLLAGVRKLSTADRPAWAPVFDDGPFIERAAATFSRLDKEFEDSRWALELLRKHSTEGIIQRLNNRPFVVCHGDPHPGNIIKTAGEYYLCDWESFKWAPLEFDAGQLLRFFPDEKGAIMALGELDEELVVASGVIRACSALAHNLNIGQPDNFTASKAREWLRTI